MFTNVKHGKVSSGELRAFNHEDEISAKKRLEAHGWVFPSRYTFDESKKLFMIEGEEDVKR